MCGLALELKKLKLVTVQSGRGFRRKNDVTVSDAGFRMKGCAVWRRKDDMREKNINETLKSHTERRVREHVLHLLEMTCDYLRGKTGSEDVTFSDFIFHKMTPFWEGVMSHAVHLIVTRSQKSFFSYDCNTPPRIEPPIFRMEINRNNRAFISPRASNVHAQS